MSRNTMRIIVFSLFFWLGAFHVQAGDIPAMLFFYSDDCEHCEAVKKEFLPEFLKKYGEHFKFVELEVSETAHFDSLYALESRLEIVYQGFKPELYLRFPCLCILLGFFILLFVIKFGLSA